MNVLNIKTKRTGKHYRITDKLSCLVRLVTSSCWLWHIMQNIDTKKSYRRWYDGASSSISANFVNWMYNTDNISKQKIVTTHAASLASASAVQCNSHSVLRVSMREIQGLRLDDILIFVFLRVLTSQSYLSLRWLQEGHVSNMLVTTQVDTHRPSNRTVHKVRDNTCTGFILGLWKKGLVLPLAIVKKWVELPFEHIKKG